MSRRSDDVLLEHYRGLGNQANHFRNRNLRGLVASMVTGTSVLDIGCGSGHLLRLLQDQGKDVVALEPSGELVHLAQALHGSLRIEHGSPEDIDEWPHRFDTITIIDVLEHMQDDVQQLRRMKTLLKPRGRLVIVVPAFQVPYGPRDAEQGHFRRYGQSDLVHKLQMTGQQGALLERHGVPALFHRLARGAALTARGPAVGEREGCAETRDDPGPRRLVSVSREPRQLDSV